MTGRYEMMTLVVVGGSLAAIAILWIGSHVASWWRNRPK